MDSSFTEQKELSLVTGQKDLSLVSKNMWLSKGSQVCCQWGFSIRLIQIIQTRTFSFIYLGIKKKELQVSKQYGTDFDFLFGALPNF